MKRLQRWTHLLGCVGSLLVIAVWWMTWSVELWSSPGEHAALFGDSFFLTASYGDLIAFNSLDFGAYHGSLIAIECDGIFYSDFEILAGVDDFDWIYWRETRHLASGTWCWTGRVRLLLLALICEGLAMWTRPAEPDSRSPLDVRFGHVGRWLRRILIVVTAATH